MTNLFFPQQQAEYLLVSSSFQTRCRCTCRLSLLLMQGDRSPTKKLWESCGHGCTFLLCRVICCFIIGRLHSLLHVRHQMQEVAVPSLLACYCRSKQALAPICSCSVVFSFLFLFHVIRSDLVRLLSLSLEHCHCGHSWKNILWWYMYKGVFHGSNWCTVPPLVAKGA